MNDSAEEQRLQEDHAARMQESANFQLGGPEKLTGTHDPQHALQKNGSLADQWYLDDGDIMCHPVLVLLFLQDFDVANARVGAERNPLKTEVTYCVMDLEMVAAETWVRAAAQQAAGNLHASKMHKVNIFNWVAQQNSPELTIHGMLYKKMEAWQTSGTLMTVTSSVTQSWCRPTCTNVMTPTTKLGAERNPQKTEGIYYVADLIAAPPEWKIDEVRLIACLHSRSRKQHHTQGRCGIPVSSSRTNSWPNAPAQEPTLGLLGAALDKKNVRRISLCTTQTPRATHTPPGHHTTHKHWG